MRVAAAGVVVALSACAGGESYGSLPPPGPSSAPPASCGADEGAGACGEAVVAQYRRFWGEVLPAAAAAAPARRRAVLAPVTAEPELTHLVRSLALLDEKRQRNYGTDVVLEQTVRVDGPGAVVEGCLDSSRSGVADAVSGKALTRGVPRNPVRADLVREADRVWRVTAITYPPGATC
ncbi:hypothetical protein CryarDRAFT_0633 [Cryptosporangium arvum DSM 44712]|uniref:Uncharacterized protein n=1 Tax=Cryptosporangium arvum DSM 44712 TaxID=927661 RepID=A0A010ZQV4_9ACTN|nr:hypothetical protein CryarDRAFT_0633 [Cryptosporangium arvum DSM 44712]